MELPKNIVQIGKPDKTHKIFVEDYVVSYIKQWNKACDGKAVGLAFYGKFYQEEEINYYFLYGASIIKGLEHRGPYLSQGEKEEIEENGKRNFEEYEFLAWCSIKEEMPEGFFVHVQGKGMEVEGYACFYEKNESMLNFMLMSGEKEREKKPEPAEEKKPERGEWKALDYVKPVEKPIVKKNTSAKRTEYMKLSAAAVFIILCVMGITTLNDYDKLEELQVVASQIIASISEQKLPDASPVKSTMMPQTIVLVEPTAVPAETPLPETPLPQTLLPQTPLPQSPVVLEITPIPVATVLPEAPVLSEEMLTAEVSEAEAEQIQPVSYTVAKGDTLISICIAKYGSLAQLGEICELNRIDNADNIQIGQTILLP